MKAMSPFRMEQSFLADNKKGSRPGDVVTKTWKLRNTGTCVWDDGFALRVTNNTSDCKAMNADDYDFSKKTSKDFVDPNEAIDIGVSLTIPNKAGEYQCTWRMQNDAGFWFGTPVTVDFEVKK